MKAWFNLVRWKNLSIILVGQLVIILSLYPKNQITLSCILFIVYTLCFTAAGNIINDCFDITADKVNKPNKLIINKYIKYSNAITGYYIINGIGVILCLVSLYLTHNILVFFIVLNIIILLFYYSKTLKGKPLIGNILVALLTALSILLISLVLKSNTSQKLVIYILSFFAFILNLTRELIKDIEDITGDKAAKFKTLPILIGLKRTNYIIKTNIYITIICLSVTNLYFSSYYVKTYIILFLICPLAYCLQLLKGIPKKNSFTKISAILKFIIAFGIFTVLFV